MNSDPTRFTAAVLQLETGEDKQENLNHIEKLLKEASERGAALAALPELMNVISRDRTKAEPEPLTGYTVSEMQRFAARYHIWLNTGSLKEKGPGEKYYNTSLLISPEGKIERVYRKLHPADFILENGPTLRESRHMESGNEISVAETALGTFGMSICYDLRFPELYRLMALDGADLFFVPSDFTYPSGEAHWHTLLKARAIENGCFVLASAQSGTNAVFRAYGHSMIIDPFGTVLAELPEGEGIITAEIDLTLVAKYRNQLGSLANRRTDIYSLKMN